MMHHQRLIKRLRSKNKPKRKLRKKNINKKWKRKKLMRKKNNS